MKYLNIFTACAGLAIAVPTLNPRQTEIDETDKICKSREMDEYQCNDYKWFCQEAGNKEPHQLQECLRNTRIFCVDDDQCGHGLECIRVSAPYALLEPGKCYRKEEQPEDRILGSASPAKDQTQAGEQESASQQTNIDETDKICKTRQLSNLQFQEYKVVCRQAGFSEPHRFKQCLRKYRSICVDDDNCGHGFQCKKTIESAENGTCYFDWYQLHDGEPESASQQTEIDETKKICKSRKFDGRSCAAFRQSCRKAGNVELDQLKNCLKVYLKRCGNDDECGNGLKCATTDPRYPNVCLDKNEQTQAVKRESASPAKDQTQAGEQESASRPTEVQAELDKICETLGFDRYKCATKRLICITERDLSFNCIKVAGEDCVHDDQCGPGFKCEVRDFSKRKICYPKDKKTQAGEQDLASQQTKIDKTDKICETRRFAKDQCDSFKWYCKHGRGIVELDQLNHCVEVLGTPCKDDGQCGHGFECYKEASAPHEDGVCDTKRKQSQAGEQE
ncbi:hypothetical protein VB005_08325 [Metarhizium brunneum]